MKKTIALKKNQDFRIVYNKRKSKADKRIVIYISKNELNMNRLGISVSKKVGNSVVRHRIKRLIKESYRNSEEKFKTGYDIVVVARAGAKGALYREIQQSLIFLLRLQGLEYICEKIRNR